VVINNGEKPASVRLQVPTKARAFRIVLRSDESKTSPHFVVERNGWLSLKMPAMTGWVLLPSSP